MKKFLMIGAACATAMASPAFAQTVTGTITINGTVASKCAAIVAGVGQATFAETVNLGELAQADGSLRSTGSLATDFGTRAYRVVCNSATPSVTVQANPLLNATTAPANYVNRVDYTAHVTVQRAGTTALTVDDSSIVAAATSSPVGAPVAATGNNISVTADTWTTPTAGAPLVAGNYTGTIVVTVSPT